MADLRLVEKVFEEPTSFILSDAKHTSIDVYIAAPNFKVKEDWIHQINELLDKQHNFLACKINSCYHYLCIMYRLFVSCLLMNAVIANK